MEIKDTTREIIIGRSSECDLTIEHFRVSRKHVRILYNEDVVLVEDLSSKNGIFIEQDGEKIKILEGTFSKNDTIFLGEVVPVHLKEIIEQDEKNNRLPQNLQIPKNRKIPTRKRCLACGFVIIYSCNECNCCGEIQRDVA